MATKEETWAMIFGGIIGAGLAAPKPGEKQELQEYRNLKQQVTLRQQRIGAPPPQKTMLKTRVYNLFVEGYRA